jgi:hypothetical protein
MGAVRHEVQLPELSSSMGHASGGAAPWRIHLVQKQQGCAYLK